NVVRESLERRDVDDLGLISKSILHAFANQTIDDGEEGGQGLARSGRCRNQDVVPGLDGRPSLFLGRRRAIERAGKPLGYGRMERGQGGHARASCVYGGQSLIQPQPPGSWLPPVWLEYAGWRLNRLAGASRARRLRTSLDR